MEGQDRTKGRARCQTVTGARLLSSPTVRAGILAVGSELLSTDRIDTNSLRLTELLERFGVELVRKSVVGDDELRIAREIELHLGESDLVLVGGGLGPTADDVTREACARALGRDLEESSDAWAMIERRFASFGRTPTPNNRRQAMLIAGAEMLVNARGTAPGQRVDLPGRTLFLLPGPTHELEGMMARHLEPWLAAQATGGGRERRTLHVALRPESEIDQRLTPAYSEFGRQWITLLANPGELQIRLTADGSPAERQERLQSMAARVRELLGDSVYAEGEGVTLERVVGDELARRGLTLAVAESCTGGLIAERITRVAGASRYFPGAVVTYSNEQKTALAGVDPDLLTAHGAVSEPVARAMAEGVRRRFGVDYGLGVTGIAGPDGGSADKPVGTVHVAVAGPDDGDHRRFQLPGGRDRVRWQSSQAALEMLRRLLLGLGKLGAP